MAESSIIAECSIVELILPLREVLSWHSSIMAESSTAQTLPLRKVLSWQRVA